MNITIKELDIHEWYDAPIIAMAKSINEGFFYFCCIRYDFSTRIRSYAALPITHLESEKLSKIFKSGNPANDIQEFFQMRVKQKVYVTDDEIESGASLQLIGKIDYDDLLRFLRFPLIDVLADNSC